MIDFLFTLRCQPVGKCWLSILFQLSPQARAHFLSVIHLDQRIGGSARGLQTLSTIVVLQISFALCSGCYLLSILVHAYDRLRYLKLLGQLFSSRRERRITHLLRTMIRTWLFAIFLVRCRNIFGQINCEIYQIFSFLCLLLGWIFFAFGPRILKWVWSVIWLLSGLVRCIEDISFECILENLIQRA